MILSLILNGNAFKIAIWKAKSKMLLTLNFKHLRAQSTTK